MEHPSRIGADLGHYLGVLLFSRNRSRLNSRIGVDLRNLHLILPIGSFVLQESRDFGERLHQLGMLRAHLL
jgi:hypothetical protein